MNIFVNDNTSFKFSSDLIDHWSKKGHTVEKEIGANPAKLEWADLVYIDFIDSNFYCYFNGPTEITKGDNHHPEWKPFDKKGAKMWVRAIDIDIWMGRHRDQRIWDYLDGMIVINQFYYDMVMREGNPPKNKLFLVRPGVNLSSFKFREKPNTYKIASVVGSMWEAKGYWDSIRILDMVRRKTGKDYTLHIRGDLKPPGWQEVAINHLIDVLGLKGKVTIYGHVPDMNAWLQDKDYALITSYKEGFSYAAGEAMACGLKPVINNFFGSDDIWHEDYLYRNWDDAVQKLTEPIDSESYRSFIYNNYDLRQQLVEYDDLLGT